MKETFIKNPALRLDDTRAELEQLRALLELLADDVVLPQFECDPDNLADILSLMIREFNRIDENLLKIQLDVSRLTDNACFVSQQETEDGDQYGEKEG